MVRDLDMEVELVGMPILRDTDGLALSSRNAYLSAAERKAALALPQSLQQAVAEIEGGADIAAALAAAKERLLSAGFGSVDYVALVDAGSLEPLETLDREARLLGAARIGATRLIDNFAVRPKNRTHR